MVCSFNPETGDVVADFTYDGTTCAVAGALLPGRLSLTGDACALKLNLAPGGKNEGPATIGGYDGAGLAALIASRSGPHSARRGSLLAPVVVSTAVALGRTTVGCRRGSAPRGRCS